MAAIPGGIPAEKRPEKAYGVAVRKRRGVCPTFSYRQDPRHILQVSFRVWKK
jgi:hypothetical protein